MHIAYLIDESINNEARKLLAHFRAFAAAA